MKLTVISVIFACFFTGMVKGNRIIPKVHETSAVQENQNRVVDVASSIHYGTHKQPQHHQVPIRFKQPTHVKQSFVKTSIPVRIFKCMQRFSVLKCMKAFILHQMERSPIYYNSGNITADFLNQILSSKLNDSNPRDSKDDELLEKFYLEMPEDEMNERLLKSFQWFFRNREIKLHFIPGMVVKVVPNEENAINLSLKRGSTWIETTGRAKNRPGDYLLQLGIPAVLMPAILMGSVIPFILPALKFATIFSGLINHAALVSAFAYVAKQAAFSPDSIKHLYYSPAYHK